MVIETTRHETMPWLNHRKVSTAPRLSKSIAIVREPQKPRIRFGIQEDGEKAGMVYKLSTMPPLYFLTTTTRLRTFVSISIHFFPVSDQFNRSVLQQL